MQGEVLDIAVDARLDSPTFGQHFAIHLSAENQLQLFIPRGFLHGYITLPKTSVFFYKCDQFYHKQAECGVMYNDSDLGIDWKVPPADRILSEKDLVLPRFNEVYKKTL